MRADPSVTLGWPGGPSGPLPRTVTPIRGETVQSYLDRLAHANHLRPDQLRRYLTDGRPDRYPRHDWLSTASNQPLQVLRTRLTGLIGRDRNLTRQQRHARPACQLCMARRGVQEPVYCWFPTYLTVCHRHRRWIGPGVHSTDDQRDLREQPAVLAAARRHAHLHRDHGAAAAVAVTDATRIHSWWARNAGTLTVPAARLDVDTHLAAYPDTIALARILADGRDRIWTTAAATPARATAISAAYARTAARFPEHRDHTTPIEQWIHDQVLIAAAPPTHPCRRTQSRTGPSSNGSIPG